ncbi:(2Fe-2S)-binding protein [Micromonospora sp. WMMA1363]|uniref:(2Fe-2S)-binding protein n=1 Tax=Micromonospora sp. WMMA1363 TaxID=3053985 RepID=UPI00259CC0BC|nr:(2Fe-2S)-binding protein [Micromonospora sp. WMMA1363]MDM4721497.1 (2Fe-2S)-binding protein [Micromonospora sp. WMMA1363]
MAAPPLSPSEPCDARPALTAASALGPFFAWSSWSDQAGWRSLAELLDGEVLAERVDAAAATLRARCDLPVDAVPVRVVASVTFLGLAARLVSPPLGAAVVGGALPLASLDDLWWRPPTAGPWPVAHGPLDALPSGDLDDRAVTTALVETAVQGPVRLLLDAFRAQFRLSPHVLWGNVAAALAGAAGVLSDTAPAHAERAGAVLAVALELPPLAGTGTVVRPDPDRARRFLVRRNCCLYYRIPGGGTCGDCVLTSPSQLRRHWRAVLAGTGKPPA